MAETKRVNITIRQFSDAIRTVYNEGGDLTTLSEKTGLKPDTVYQKYMKLKKDFAARGVTVPPLATGKTRGRKLDMDALAAEFKEVFKDVGIPQPALPEEK